MLLEPETFQLRQVNSRLLSVRGQLKGLDRPEPGGTWAAPAGTTARGLLRRAPQDVRLFCSDLSRKQWQQLQASRRGSAAAVAITEARPSPPWAAARDGPAVGGARSARGGFSESCWERAPTSGAARRLGHSRDEVGGKKSVQRPSP